MLELANVGTKHHTTSSQKSTASRKYCHIRVYQDRIALCRGETTNWRHCARAGLDWSQPSILCSVPGLIRHNVVDDVNILFAPDKCCDELFVFTVAISVSLYISILSPFFLSQLKFKKYHFRHEIVFHWHSLSFLIPLFPFPKFTVFH